jgi:uncharacterized membrane protein YhaH (DUF805 family)
MGVFHYLFSFRGRINRARNWLFMPIAFVWYLAMEIIALFGFDWLPTIKSLIGAYDKETEILDPAKLVWPQLNTQSAQITIAILLVMLVFITYAGFAIFVKRLHDRNKSAWWLVPYWLVPFGLGNYAAFTAVPVFFGPMTLTGAITDGIGTLITLWVFVEMFILSGTKGSNRFGVDPLAKGPVYCELDNSVYGCISRLET